MARFISAIALLLLASPVASQAQVSSYHSTSHGEICSPPFNTFTVKVNFFEGQLGYYEFEECNGVNPTIGLRVGERYTFVQQDPSNWFHPLGFAWGPDGALDDQDELEPTIDRTGLLGCASSATCPSPKYYLNNEFLGEGGTENFGLDSYEPKFFLPLLDWIDQGRFEVDLTIEGAFFEQDAFYFCHIHQFMSGRIKFLDSHNRPLVRQNVPRLGYEYDMPGPFDRSCGTFGLDAWQLPNQFCPDRYVCNEEQASSFEHRRFAECVDAMNCHMMAGMTTNIAQDERALFIYQMIPHHENAVNMAKALLPSTPCNDLTNEDDPNCIMQVISREIINTQNFQIQTMRKVLETLQAPPTDNCEVPIQTITKKYPLLTCSDRCDNFSSRPRYHMMKWNSGSSICYYSCVAERAVQRRVSGGWQCGRCP